MKLITLSLTVAAFVGSCQGAPTQGDAAAAPSANAGTASASIGDPDWVDSSNAIHYRNIRKGLSHPWAVAALPNGEYLVTLREGRLLRIDAGGGEHVIAGVPKVFATGQGGLLDVILAPDFASSKRIYLSFAEPGEEDTAGTAAGYGTLNGDTLENFRVIYRQLPKLKGGMHFGSRLVVDRSNHLWISQGERNQKELAQDLEVLQGKLIRMNADGSIPADNPFANGPGVRQAIWSYGHRNVQGMSMDPRSGKVWLNEHGPRGGDEINIPQAGKNYGWPIASYGMDYASNKPYPETRGEHVSGMEEPHFVWMKSPGVSGMAFFTGHPGHRWNDSIFVGALAEKSLIRLKLDGDKVTEAERLLTNEGWRIRDVRVTDDGRVLVLTDEDSGRLIEIAPTR